MIPRKRPDIGWSDLLYAARCCIAGGGSAALARGIELSDGGHGLACLSARSGFDALLQALDMAPGTEVLVSALTIRDMARILEAHGLVAVPLDLDMRRLELRVERMAQALTPRTRALLVAHLFGARMPMQPIADFAKAHQLLLIEDCAQCYAADGYRGHPASDVSLFSFGPIKTATALGGGLLCFRDAALREQVSRLQQRWPEQSARRYLARVLKYALLLALSSRAPYSLFAAVCRLAGKTHDRIIAAAVRGFAGEDFFAAIRQRPCFALLALLRRRLAGAQRSSIARRVALGRLATRLVPASRPGELAVRHTHWVFPIFHAAPEALMRHLWRRGFDATRGGSSLCALAPAAEAAEALRRLLYLPVHAGMSRRDVARLAAAVKEFDALHGHNTRIPGATTYSPL